MVTNQAKANATMKRSDGSSPAHSAAESAMAEWWRVHTITIITLACFAKMGYHDYHVYEILLQWLQFLWFEEDEEDAGGDDDGDELQTLEIAYGNRDMTHCQWYPQPWDGPGDRTQNQTT